MGIHGYYPLLPAHFLLATPSWPQPSAIYVRRLSSCGDIRGSTETYILHCNYAPRCTLAIRFVGVQLSSESNRLSLAHCDARGKTSEMVLTVFRDFNSTLPT